MFGDGLLPLVLKSEAVARLVYYLCKCRPGTLTSTQTEALLASMPAQRSGSKFAAALQHELQRQKAPSE